MVYGGWAFPEMKDADENLGPNKTPSHKTWALDAEG